MSLNRILPLASPAWSCSRDHAVRVLGSGRPVVDGYTPLPGLDVRAVHDPRTFVPVADLRYFSAASPRFTANPGPGSRTAPVVQAGIGVALDL